MNIFAKHKYDLVDAIVEVHAVACNKIKRLVELLDGHARVN